MQRALTVKGEEARWIKKGGQRDIKGNGEGGGKILSQPSYIISFVPFPRNRRLGKSLKIHSKFFLKLLNHSSATGIVCRR